MRIPRGSAEDESVKPAWVPLQDADGSPCKPLIRCQCGALMNIRLHHVHPDGRVTESFHHPPLYQGCGFHEHLVLDGWTGEEFPPT